MKIGFYPGEEKKRQWGREIHPWVSLVTGVLKENGCSIYFPTLDELRRHTLPQDVDILHLNWPQTLIDPDGYKLNNYLPFAIFSRWFMRQTDRLFEKIAQSEIPVVWQIHDLPFSSDLQSYELRLHVFKGLFKLAEGLVFYENSAQAPVYELLGSPGKKVVGIAPLGDYCKLHGPPVSRTEARQRLGIDWGKKMLLYPGKVRDTRDPTEFVKTFIEISDETDLLYVVGQGVDKLQKIVSHPRVVFRPTYVGHEEFRDLFCASDFVVNHAHRYLGSAIIRAAMGYGIPVIAQSFGCTADLAKGAYIEIDDAPGCLGEAIRRALDLPSVVYREMVAAALERHAERPWSAYANGCMGVYRALLSDSCPRTTVTQRKDRYEST